MAKFPASMINGGLTSFDRRHLILLGGRFLIAQHHLTRAFMFGRTFVALAALFAGTPLANAAAQQSEAIAVDKGQAVLRGLDAPFETVVVGDPGVVTASVVDEQTLAITGVAAGRTNIILIGPGGTSQANWRVDVEEPAEVGAEMFRGNTLTLLRCDPHCVAQSRPEN